MLLETHDSVHFVLVDFSKAFDTTHHALLAYLRCEAKNFTRIIFAITLSTLIIFS